MDPQQAADQIGKLSDLLLEPVDQAVGLSDLIEMVDRLDDAARNIRSASTAAKALANRLIDNAGEQRVVLGSGIVAERTGSWRRSDIDRAGLVKYVRTAAALDDIRLDAKTGELRPTEAVTVDLYERCFRFEPKWTELKNLGVDDDEFCRREFVASVKITKAKVL
jgi:hypothetical protein